MSGIVKSSRHPMTSGKENYVISSDDTTGNDLWTRHGERSTDFGEEGDSLTPNGGRPMKHWLTRFKKRRKRIKILSAIPCPAVVGRCCSRISKSVLGVLS